MSFRESDFPGRRVLFSRWSCTITRFGYSHDGRVQQRIYAILTTRAAAGTRVPVGYPGSKLPG